jgi:hypothetical protein
MTPTPEPTATFTLEPTATEAAGLPASSWQAGISLILSDKCGRCHNSATLKGDMDITGYQTALEGGSSGAGIVPGNPSASGIVAKQRRGGHPAQLTEVELQALVDWIAAGAPEQPGYTSWADGIAFLMDERCVECHGGDEPVGQLDLSNYESALAGGSSGPAILPGEADNSLILQIQAGGSHPGQLSEVELSALRDWIDAGAPPD